MTGFPQRDKALEDFFAAWDYEPVEEYVALDDALGRVTSQALVARWTIPAHAVSGCDGIAVRSADFAGGRPDTSSWRPGDQYVRADTGDDFPDEYDAVIMAEEVDFEPDGSVRIQPDVPVYAGCNVRPAGSSVSAGTPCISADARIRATDLGALAICGYDRVPVWRRPRVAFIPTGDELIPAGVEPQRGQNVDSNSHMVRAMLFEMGAEPVVFPIVPDVSDQVGAALDKALLSCDLVIVNGGTALGGADGNFELIEKRGRLIHHYIAAAPGRPLAMGVADGKPVVNLPGPAMGAWFGGNWCISACVARMLHQKPASRRRVRAKVPEGVEAGGPMANLLRMNAAVDEDGVVSCTYQPFTEGQLVQALSSNAQMVRESYADAVPAGGEIELELLRPPEDLPRA